MLQPSYSSGLLYRRIVLTSVPYFLCVPARRCIYGILLPHINYNCVYSIIVQWNFVVKHVHHSVGYSGLASFLAPSRARLTPIHRDEWRSSSLSQQNVLCSYARDAVVGKFHFLAVVTSWANHCLHLYTFLHIFIAHVNPLPLL